MFGETRRIVETAAFSRIGPVFFVDPGAKIVFGWKLRVGALPCAAVMTIGIAVFQVMSAGLEARYTNGMISVRRWPSSSWTSRIPAQHPAEGAFFTLMITAFCLNVPVPVTFTGWRPSASAQRPGRSS